MIINTFISDGGDIPEYTNTYLCAKPVKPIQMPTLDLYARTIKTYSMSWI